MSSIKIIFLVLALFSSHVSSDSIQVTTWNIEHLGSPGRGFGGGFGSGNLPIRTPEQLQLISNLILEIGSDIIALQEIAVSHHDLGMARSSQLDKIIEFLGNDWAYYLPVTGEHQNSPMVSGYLWDSTKVNVLSIFPMALPDYILKGQPIFDRQPLVAYIELKDEKPNRNDLSLINVHLKSGQNNEENHLVAMVFIEQELNGLFKSAGIKESDRIILGDFNDNPYLISKNGKYANLSTMYDYMSDKGYQDALDPSNSSIRYTRMNDNLDSLIDHIFVNSSMGRHITGKPEIYYPEKGVSTYGQWRHTYSDHFPITINVKLSADDDKD